MPAFETPIVLLLAAEPAVRVGSAAPLPLGAREGALLAWLAIEGATSRFELARLLWPESAPESARTALRQRLFQLRRIAGEPLVVGSQTIRLADGVAHDLADADGVLGGRDLALGVAYDSWLERQRAERRERSRRSLVERAERAEADADPRAAIGHARELLARDPLSEDAHRRLIRLLYLAGERPAALLAFDRCEQVLKDEVGVAPGPETMALLQTILRAEAACVAPATAKRAVPAALLRPPRRVGRADVWETLTGAHEASVRLVIGEAGMGKSRLLLDLLESPLSPRGVLAAARPGDTAVPYALASRLLRGVIAECGFEPTQRQRVMLGPVLPELGDAMASAPSSGAAIAAASAELLAAASQQGLGTVVVDDLQFADDGSAEWLLALIGEAGPLWIVATRPYPLRPAARALVDAIEARRDAASVTLQPLTTDDLGELLATIGIDSLGAADRAGAALASLHRHTGGNPFHVLETVKALLAEPVHDPERWPVAASVVRLIQQRLEGLTPLARSVARCAAIAGQDSDSRLIAHVIGKAPIELGDAFAELQAAQLLGGDGQFPHDLVAEAALASVPHAIEKPLHADVAQWLETHRDLPGRTAEHWLAAAVPLRAAPLLVAAGEQSLAAWRPDEAAPRFDQASSIHAAAGDRRGAFDALYRSAAARSQQNYGSHLLPIHDALLDLADSEGQLAMAAVFLVGCLIEQRRFVEATEAAHRAMAQAAAAGLPEIEAQHRYGLALLHWERSEIDAAAVELREVLRLLAGVPLERRLFRWHCIETSADSLAGAVSWLSGRYAESEARMVEMRRRAQREGDIASMRDFDRALSQMALEQGGLKRALARSASATGVLDARGLEANGVIRSSAWRGHLIALDGDLGLGLELQSRAVEMWERHQIRHLAQPLMLARLQHTLGRRDLARARLMDLGQRFAPDGSVGSLWLLALSTAGGHASASAAWLEDVARLADLSGRVLVLCTAASGCAPDAVLPSLDRELAITRDAGADGLALSLLARRVAALQSLGQHEEAAAAAAEAWQRVEAGVCAYDLLLPDLAALLCPPLATTDPALARRIAGRGLAWLQKAAATLPAPWRDNYLARAPALDGLRAAGVAMG